MVLMTMSLLLQDMDIYSLMTMIILGSMILVKIFLQLKQAIINFILVQNRSLNLLIK